MTPIELSALPLEERAMLAGIQPGPIYALREASPSSFYVRYKDGHWLELSASQGDLHLDKSETVFHVPRLSIHPSPDSCSLSLTEIGCIPDFAFLTYLIRTHWVEPAPFDARLGSTLKSGPNDTIPDSANTIGAGLFGVVFHDIYHDPLLLIALVEGSSKTLQVVTDLNVIAEVVDESDPFFSAI